MFQKHKSPWVLGSLIFRHAQYIHLWIKFYSSCDYHLTGITQNLMNLNSIQQQPKKKKAVDTAAERVLVPLWGAFSKKKKIAKWKNPSCETSVRAHSCERQPRANLRGMVKMRAARMNLKVFNLQTKRNFQQSERFFSIVLQLHSHILNWHELYYSSIFTSRSLLILP